MDPFLSQLYTLKNLSYLQFNFIGNAISDDGLTSMLDGVFNRMTAVQHLSLSMAKNGITSTAITALTKKVPGYKDISFMLDVRDS